MHSSSNRKTNRRKGFDSGSNNLLLFAYLIREDHNNANTNRMKLTTYEDGNDYRNASRMQEAMAPAFFCLRFRLRTFSLSNCEP